VVPAIGPPFAKDQQFLVASSCALPDAQCTVQSPDQTDHEENTPMRPPVSTFLAVWMLAAAGVVGARPGDIDPDRVSHSRVYSWGSLRMFPLADGRLLLADRSSAEGGDGRPILIALGDDGQTDPSFGESGKQALAVPADSRWTEVHSITPDGKVLATATAGGRNLILRLNPDGTPDASFGVGGRLILSERAGFSVENVGTLVERIAVRENGRMLVLELAWDCTNWWDGDCFHAGGPGFLRQIKPDGSPDLDYGEGGQVQIPEFSPRQLIESSLLLADGRFVLADRNGELRLVAADGRIVRSIFTGTRTDAITALPDGRLLLAAASTDGSALEITRLSADGSPDATFGGGTGRVNVGFGRRLLPLRGITASSDGRHIYVALHPENLPREPIPRYGTAVLRLLSTGEVDQAFGDGGLSLLSYLDLRHLALVLDRDDRPLVQGSGQVVRLLSGDAQGHGILSVRSRSFIPGVPEENAIVRLEVGRLAGSKGNTGARVAVYPIREAEPWTRPERVAVEGRDFSLITTRLDWSDGDDADKSILIQILDDIEPEEAEQFRVEIVEPTGGVLILGQGSTLSIDANDTGSGSTPGSGSAPIAAVPAGNSRPEAGGGSLRPSSVGLLLLLLLYSRRRVSTSSASPRRFLVASS
jgi:uncharacterized delta-60 repeat protein